MLARSAIPEAPKVVTDAHVVSSHPESTQVHTLLAALAAVSKRLETADSALADAPADSELDGSNAANRWLSDFSG